MRQLVKVNEGHIADGVPKSASRCPVALALCDKGFDIATVTEKDITASPMHGVWLYGETPEAVREFLVQFDAEGGRAVDPFDFYIVLRRTE